eukprot:UN00871
MFSFSVCIHFKRQNELIYHFIARQIASQFSTFG